ncbi:hypothetical protein LTR85_002685 [Meristemomyces frigidus]|nr:hypothetical protein LTR85_002685 [Meristemomyces frigidus]
MASAPATDARTQGLADKTEQTAWDTTLVFRYIQARALRKGHPNPGVRSAEDLVRDFNRGDYFHANLVIGTAARAAKRNRIRLIDGAWGAGWFDRIPAGIRDPEWTVAEECSVALLTEMATNAKQGIDCERARECWRTAVHNRTDYGVRRELGLKGPLTPHLLPSDVAALNWVVNDTDHGRRTSDIFFPEGAKEDQLRVELVAPGGVAVSSKRKHSTAPPARGAQKRKRESTLIPVLAENDVDEDGWQRAANGKSMMKRVRKHLIRKPVAYDDDASHSLPSWSTTFPSPQQQASS